MNPEDMLAAMLGDDWTCEHGVVRAEGCREFACGGDGYVEREQRSCEQDDHDAVWQAGREAGYRDALIALAEHRGEFFDELDRHIADSLKRDQEYVKAHDAAVLAAALRVAADDLPVAVRAQVVRDARDEVARHLAVLPKRGAHVRAWWALTRLEQIAEALTAPPTSTTPGAPQ